MLGVLALLLASGCDGTDGDDDMHGLMAGMDPGRVGGPAKPVLAAAAAAVAPAGLGPLVSLVKFQAKANTTDPHHLHADPATLTGSIYANGNSGQAGLLVSRGFGPLVAVVKWGAANSGEQTAEFDIPINSLAAVQGGGTLFTVVGDYLEIAARNDASLIPRVGDAALGADGAPALPTVGATIGVGNRSGASSPLTRTIWIAFNPAGGLAAATSGSASVPKFAKSFRVFRTDATQPVSVTVLGDSTLAQDGPYNIAANVPSPEFPLNSTAGTVQVTNTGAAALTSVGVIFNIGL